MSRDLHLIPEDFTRATAAVAYLDDPGYGAGRAIARTRDTWRVAA